MRNADDFLLSSLSLGLGQHGTKLGFGQTLFIVVSPHAAVCDLIVSFGGAEIELL